MGQSSSKPDIIQECHPLELRDYLFDINTSFAIQNQKALNEKLILHADLDCAFFIVQMRHSVNWIGSPAVAIKLYLFQELLSLNTCVFKTRDTLPTKIHLVKAMVFPVAMYGCENWTVKKADRRRIDAFELWCWRRLLRVPWTARRSSQSLLKEISPRCSLEGMMLKLKLQYFGHLMRRVGSLEKTLMLGGTGGRRRRGWQRMRWLDGIADLMDVSLSDGQGGLVCCNSWSCKESDTTERLNWNELNMC